jgi:hypothetical protein
LEKDGAGYAVIVYQKPVDSSNSIIVSARFCASGATGAYTTFNNIGDNFSGQNNFVNFFVFKTRLAS